MTEVMLATIGWTEVLLIALIVVLLFGSSQIPKLMRGLGQGVSEFKKGVRGEESPLPPAQAQAPQEEKKDKPAS